MEKRRPEIRSREISLVFGKTGMGKSNWIKSYLNTMSRAIVLDPLDEYDAMEFVDIGAMVDYLDGRESFRVKSCNILHLEQMGEIVDAMNNVTFIIEEAQRCLPASRLDLPDSIQRIIFLGRHFSRSLVIAAQRPSIVHIAARSQWTRIVSFNLTETADVKWIESTSGYDVMGEDDIRKLSVGDYFEILPGNFERKHAPLYMPRRKETKSNVVEFVEWLSAANR